MSTLKRSILDALAEAGIKNVTEVETVKNGILCQGYQIETGTNVKPVVYYSPEETVEAFVQKVLRVAEQPIPEVDVENLISKEKLLSDTTYLCLQRKGEESLLVKRDYLNLETYVRVNVPLGNEMGSIKITKAMLDQAGVSEDELFEVARANSVKLASICTMAEALGAPAELFGEVPFYVGTYRKEDGSLLGHGAAVLALPEVLHDFLEAHGYENGYILPSSTEEVLLLPMEADPEELSNMVSDVNSSTVDPTMWLENCVYYIDNTGEVTIAASHREEVA